MVSTLHLGSGGTLTYRCDASTHRVIVSDDHGRPRFAFGGYGARPGQLDTPLDVVFVAPEFHGERLPNDGSDLLWLAVADYGNRRIQVFELDGCLVGGIASDGLGGASRGGPCQLTWRSPVLDVGQPDGQRSSVHLAAALLHGSQRSFASHRSISALSGAWRAVHH